MVTVQDSLTWEEVGPALDLVLGQQRAWALHTAALLARSRIEARDRRTVERAMMQVGLISLPFSH